MCYPHMFVVSFIALCSEKCGVWCLQAEDKVGLCAHGATFTSYITSGPSISETTAHDYVSAYF